jgi:hypothetical protein
MRKKIVRKPETERILRSIVRPVEGTKNACLNKGYRSTRIALFYKIVILTNVMWDEVFGQFIYFII